jgi:hypothetical protein
MGGNFYTTPDLTLTYFIIVLYRHTLALFTYVNHTDRDYRVIFFLSIFSIWSQLHEYILPDLVFSHSLQNDGVVPLSSFAVWMTAFSFTSAPLNPKVFYKSVIVIICATAHEKYGNR